MLLIYVTLLLLTFSLELSLIKLSKDLISISMDPRECCRKNSNQHLGTCPCLAYIYLHFWRIASCLFTFLKKCFAVPQLLCSIATGFNFWDFSFSKSANMNFELICTFNVSEFLLHFKFSKRQFWFLRLWKCAYLIFETFQVCKFKFPNVCWIWTTYQHLALSGEKTYSNFLCTLRCSL